MAKEKQKQALFVGEIVRWRKSKGQCHEVVSAVYEKRWQGVRWYYGLKGLSDGKIKSTNVSPVVKDFHLWFDFIQMVEERLWNL